MLTFDLESWEYFEAPTGPPPAPRVWITRVWIDDEQGRIYGMGINHPDPVWLHPNRVPGRVVRRDPSKPTHPLEWRRIFQTSAVPRVDEDDAEEKLAARLAAIPPPEVPARPAMLEEMPRGLRGLGRAAAAAGFAQHATYSRGPRLDQYWRVVETSENIRIKGKHPDGRRFVVAYVTKTAERGKDAGKTSWKPELGYALVEGVWTSCGPTALEAYFTNGSLTVTQQEAS